MDRSIVARVGVRMSKPPTEHAHRGYVIRTMAVGKLVRARAFTGPKAVMDAEANSLDNVLKQMRERLDARDEAARGKRQGDIPTADEFVDAFNRVATQMVEAQRKMLRALYEAPGHSLTATEIAAAAGYTRHMTANEKFGKLARLLAEDLGYEPEKREDGTVMWTTTVATEAPRDADTPPAQFRWQLRPQVVEAITRLNLFPAVPSVVGARPW